MANHLLNKTIEEKGTQENKKHHIAEPLIEKQKTKVQEPNHWAKYHTITNTTKDPNSLTHLPHSVW